MIYLQKNCLISLKESKTTNNSGNVSDNMSKNGVNNDNLSNENNSNLNTKK